MFNNLLKEIELGFKYGSGPGSEALFLQLHGNVLRRTQCLYTAKLHAVAGGHNHVNLIRQMALSNQPC